MKDSQNLQWFHYVETSPATSRPVKLDELLRRRMKAFLAAKQAK